MKNYYNVLGISDNATGKDVNEAFKKLAVKFHPDKNAGDPYYAHWFKEINEAKQVLSDKDERAEYDFKLGNYEDSYELLRQQHAVEEFKSAKQQHVLLHEKSKISKLFLAGLFAVVIGLLYYLIPRNNNVDANNDEPKQSWQLVETQLHDSLTSTATNNLENEIHNINQAANENPLEKKTGNATVLVQNSPSKNNLSKGENKSVVLTNKPLSNSGVRGLSIKEKDKIFQLLKSEKDVKCVQVVQASNGNIKPDFEIARLLQERGYVIAGRQTILTNVQGYLLEKNGECAKLILGTFQ